MVDKTQEELIEKIHIIHHELRRTIEISDEDYHYDAVLVADTKITALIKEALPELAKEAGYKSPEECLSCANKFANSFKNFTRVDSKVLPDAGRYNAGW